ncbi:MULTISPECIES: Hsp20/alpha crystallin family protein [Halomonadaceae]|uniref:Hsp20/alpha crystallin family protein n=1 Tax=Halomonadaceae TaxID=28256 RepID=UPI001583AEC2|nr:MULTISPECIES: Hsp20/alpha crystallin family protein [Halomonas]MDI4638766.1 Hsp20/alpha crystallin family protein [Halomonas sp. BMC7]NUJ59751.1 Hsp20/alpha crystallin family protein [Halomonas taeanensis]
MFEDLRRFDIGSSSERDVFQQWLDSLLSPTGITDLRAVPRGSYPMINVGRTDDAVRIYVFAAGLGPDDLELNVQDNLLTVSGQRQAEASSDQTQGRPQLRRERFQGRFKRTISLPDGLDTEKAEARCKDGVFEIHIPKREELKPRRIEVQVA